MDLTSHIGTATMFPEYLGEQALPKRQLARPSRLSDGLID